MKTIAVSQRQTRSSYKIEATSHQQPSQIAMS